MKRSALPLVRGRFGLGSEVAEPQLPAGGSEVMGDVAAAVVRHHFAQVHASFREPGDDALKEVDR